MPRRFPVSVAFATIAAVAATRVGESALTPQSRQLTVHEWGTFTTVAGPDGRAIDWLPLGGPTDLPCFVEHFNRNPAVKVIPNGVTLGGSNAAYDAARQELSARVRMETPVLYFYADHDTTVHVRVRFNRGLMTEWYPPAAVAQPMVGAATLRDPRTVSMIEWPSVHVSPEAPATFPRERADSRYYAARNTDAAPIAVHGQRERFLFYRGVADFDAPLSAAVDSSGHVRVKNLGEAELPAAFLFERRGAKLGFRVIGALKDERLMAPPSLDGSFDDLRQSLEQALIAQGLTAKEASAMLETWRDSWFEEGMRVIYIVPRSSVDAILPLDITPAPSHVTRVFVGRMEVLTSTTQQAVRAALETNDNPVLERYARFLGPITDRILATTSDAAMAGRIRQATNKALAVYLHRMTICE